MTDSGSETLDCLYEAVYRSRIIQEQIRILNIDPFYYPILRFPSIICNPPLFF